MRWKHPPAFAICAGDPPRGWRTQYLEKSALGSEAFSALGQVASRAQRLSDAGQCLDIQADSCDNYGQVGTVFCPYIIDRLV